MILIDMEMPKDCAHCKILWFAPFNQEFRCKVTDKAAFSPQELSNRRKDCPLHELEEK